MRKSSVRGMVFSSLKSKSNENPEIKKPPSLAVFKESGWLRASCFYEYLPLFHRLLAGTAKVKIKEKVA
ncbi:MAG: hypothetical protein ACI8WM_002995 [Burkholderiaceae bacterium]|jgi:hypothetical protein